MHGQVVEVLTRQPERDVPLKCANESVISEANCDLADKTGHFYDFRDFIGRLALNPIRKLKKYEKRFYGFASDLECTDRFYTIHQLEPELLIPFSDWQGGDQEYWGDFKGMVSWIKDSYDKDRILTLKFIYGFDVERVKVGSYVVPWILAPILQMLLARYCNGLHPSNLSAEVVSLCYTFLCTLIHSMSKTRVRHMNEDLLKEWCRQAMCLKSLGFEIGFLFERLRQLSCAYFKLRLQIEVPKRLAKEIEEAEQKIARLVEDIGKTKLEKAKREAELERVKKISWKQSSAKSNFLNMCLRETSILEGKSAGEDLIK